MTDQNAPVVKHHASAKQHLAGVKASQVYIQALAAAHLLDSQSPIKDTPVQPAETGTP